MTASVEAFRVRIAVKGKNGFIVYGAFCSAALRIKLNVFHNKIPVGLYRLKADRKSQQSEMLVTARGAPKQQEKLST